MKKLLIISCIFIELLLGGCCTYYPVSATPPIYFYMHYSYKCLSVYPCEHFFIEYWHN